MCAAGKGWNEDIDNAKCVACEWPKTQSSTSPYDICRLQYCNGGRARKGSSEFLVTLNPATDNDNCEKCEDGKTSPPGTDPCRAVVCPSNMRAKSNDKIDQSLAHDNSQNCEAMSCSEIGFTCGTHGTITGKPADNTCACDCGDSGYTGNKCDDQINECDPNNDLDTSDHPCNRGTCVDKDGKANGYYECDCADTGYRGNNCNEQINECDETGNLKHQCHADAECTDGTSGYTSANKNKGYVRVQERQRGRLHVQQHKRLRH